MISEKEVAKLSYPDAPKMVTDKVPGPKTQKALEDSSKFESDARGAGRFPCVYDDAMDNVIFSMLSRGVIMVPCGRYGNVLRFMPSLTITREYCEKATDILLDIAKEI